VIHAAFCLMNPGTIGKGCQVVKLITADVENAGNLTSKIPLRLIFMRVNLRLSFNFCLYLHGKFMNLLV
jgi:hypothetical protein